MRRLRLLHVQWTAVLAPLCRSQRSTHDCAAVLAGGLRRRLQDLEPFQPADGPAAGRLGCRGSESPKPAPLGTSGPLTSQQGFISCNCGTERLGSEMLWEALRWRVQQPETRNRRTQFPLRVEQAQRLAQATSGSRHPPTVPIPSPRRGATHRARHSRANFVSSQAIQPQRVTQPSSERPQTYTGALPVCRRWEAGFSLRAFGPSLLTRAVSCRQEALPAWGTGRIGLLNRPLRRPQVSCVVVRYDNPTAPGASWPVCLSARRRKCSAA